MPSEWQKFHRTQRGRVVYDRKIHLWTEKDVSRITRRFVDDNVGWVQEKILPLFYYLTEYMLDAILAALGITPALSKTILDFLIRMADKLISWLVYYWGSGYSNQLAWECFYRLVEPYMTDDDLLALGGYLKDHYA